MLIKTIFTDGDQYDEEISPKFTKAGGFRERDNSKGGKKSKKKDKSANPEK